MFAGDRFLTAFRRPVGLHWAPRIPLLPPWCQRTPLHYRVSDNVYSPATRSCPHTRSSEPDRTRHEFTVPIFLHVFILRFVSVRRRSQPNSFCYFWINPTTTTVKMVSICFFYSIIQANFPSTSISLRIVFKLSAVTCRRWSTGTQIVSFVVLDAVRAFACICGGLIWLIFTVHISLFIIVEGKKVRWNNETIFGQECPVIPSNFESVVCWVITVIYIKCI